MSAFTEELKEISIEFEEMTNETLWKRAGWTMLGGVGAGVLSLAAVGLGTRQMPVQAGGLTLLMGGATTLTGVHGISQANAKKSMTVNEMIKTVAQLNAQLMAIFTPLRNVLEDMKKVSQELSQKSSVLVSTVGVPACTAFSEIEKFQQLLKEKLSEYEDAAWYISQSAEKSQRTVDELAKMRSILKEFE